MVVPIPSSRSAIEILILPTPEPALSCCAASTFTWAERVHLSGQSSTTATRPLMSARPRSSGGPLAPGLPRRGEGDASVAPGRSRSTFLVPTRTADSGRSRNRAGTSGRGMRRTSPRNRTGRWRAFPVRSRSMPGSCVRRALPRSRGIGAGRRPSRDRRTGARARHGWPRAARSGSSRASWPAPLLWPRRCDRRCGWKLEETRIEALFRGPEDVCRAGILGLGDHGGDGAEERADLCRRAGGQIRAQDAGIVITEDENAPVLGAHAQEPAQVPAQLPRWRGAGEQDPPGLVPATREELLHVGVPGDEPQEPGSGVLDGRGKPSAVEAPARSTGVQDPAADARVPGAIEDCVQRLPQAQLRKDAAGQRAQAGSPLSLASFRRACSHSAQNGTPFRAAAVSAAACSFPVSSRSAGEGRPADGAFSPRARPRKTTILPSTTLPSSLAAYFGMLPSAACLSARSRGAVKEGRATGSGLLSPRASHKSGWRWRRSSRWRDPRGQSILGVQPLARRERTKVHDGRNDLALESPPDHVAGGAGDHHVERDRPTAQVEIEGALRDVLRAQPDRYRLARAHPRRQQQLEAERIRAGGGHDETSVSIRTGAGRGAGAAGGGRQRERGGAREGGKAHGTTHVHAPERANGPPRRSAEIA